MNPCGRSPNTLFSTPVSTSRSTALTNSQAPIRLSRRLNDPICVPRRAQSVPRKVDVQTARSQCVAGLLDIPRRHRVQSTIESTAAGRRVRAADAEVFALGGDRAEAENLVNPGTGRNRPLAASKQTTLG